MSKRRQVEDHLAGHLDRLPGQRRASRAIVSHMKADEAHHAQQAQRARATPLPLPLRWMMRGAAKVMTTAAHHIWPRLMRTRLHGWRLDLRRLGQHRRRRTILLVRQCHRPGHGLSVELLPGDDEMRAHAREHLRVG